MAFSFGGTPAAASSAPAAGGFSFAAPAAPAAPAASSAFSFGSTPAAPVAPAATSAFSFGGTPATPTPAAAPSAFGFSSTPVPATAASTPTGTSLFGAPAASPGLGTNTFQQQQQQQQQLQQQPQHAMTANTPYKFLPPNAQKMIDDIYSLIHQHEQTMSSVSTMQPALLKQQSIDAADVAAGTQQLEDSSNSSTATLGNKITSLQHKIRTIKQDLEYHTNQSNEAFSKSYQTFDLTYKCGVYPLQSSAARNGITQEQMPELHQLVNAASQIAQKLNQALMDNATSVDYVEGMPSVYLWSAVDDFVEKMNDLGMRLQRLNKVIENKRTFLFQSSQMGMNGGMNMNGNFNDGSNVGEDLTLAITNQIEELARIAGAVATINEQMKSIRQEYLNKERLLRVRFHSHSNGGIGIVGAGTGISSGSSNFDPFRDADDRERDYQRKLEIEAHKKTIQAAPPAPVQQPQQQAAALGAPAPGGLFGSTPAPAAGGGLFGSTPVPAAGGLFGSPAPVAGGGLFGGTTPAPAPGGLFGSSAPAPASGGLFGSAAPAPATGAFGSTPAPAPVGLFGSTTPAAPAPGGFGFGATPAAATTPAPVSGGLFGAAAPAPVATSAFSAAPASSGGFGFGAAASTPAAASSTTRSNRRKPGRRR